MLDHGEEYFNPAIGLGLVRLERRGTSVPSYIPIAELRPFKSLIEHYVSPDRWALQFFCDNDSHVKSVTFHFDRVEGRREFLDSLAKALAVQYIFSGVASGGRWHEQRPLPLPTGYNPEVFNTRYACQSGSCGVLMGP